MKKKILFYLLLIHVINLQAQDGSSVYNFLRFPSSTRAGALGGTNISVIENDLSMIFQNPGFLGPEMDMNLNLSYMFYIGDIGSGNVAFAKALGDKSAWGVGVNYFNYGEIKHTSKENELIETISPKDICTNAFLSRDLTDRIRGGVALKFVYSNFEKYTSWGLGFDLGLSYYDKDNSFSMGLVGKNIGRQIQSYDEKTESMPWDIQLGMSKRLTHAPIRFSFTAMYLNKWDFYNPDGKEDSFGTALVKHLVFGVEFVPNDNFWVGVGYNPKTGSDMKLLDANKMAGFSAGAGIRVKAFDVSCSVGRYHPSATSFMVGITTSLSEIKL